MASDGLTHQVRALLEALAALVTAWAGGAAEAAAAAAALSAHKPAKGGGAGGKGTGKGGNKSLGALLAQAIGAAGGEGGKGGASGEDQGTSWLALWKPTVAAHHGALDQAASLLLDVKGRWWLADAPTDTSRRADLWEDAAGVVVAMVLEAAPAASMATDEVLATTRSGPPRRDHAHDLACKCSPRCPLPTGARLHRRDRAHDADRRHGVVDALAGAHWREHCPRLSMQVITTASSPHRCPLEGARWHAA